MMRAILLIAYILLVPGVVRLWADSANRAISLEAVLLKKAPVPEREDIAPYDDALVMYTYKVRKILSGKLKASSIGVYHWGRYDTVKQDIAKRKIGKRVKLTVQPWSQRKELHRIHISEPNGVDLSLPLFMDSGQRITLLTKRGKRYDYGGRINGRMADVLAIRHHLKLVVFGDSRAKAGVRPEYFYPEEIKHTPVAYNMAVDSTGIKSFDDLTQEVFVHLPKLECVVWNFSPRMLNKRWSGRELKIKGSHGNKYDRKHADSLWRSSRTDFLLRSSQIQWHVGTFGYEPRTKKRRNKRIKKGVKRWEFDKKDWERLKRVAQSLAKNNIYFIVFTPPMAVHPTKGAVDNDGTSRKAHSQDLQRLEKLADRYPTMRIVDIHQSGGHDFEPKYFSNVDHLNAYGAHKLSPMLEDARRRLMSKDEQSKVAEAP